MRYSHLNGFLSCRNPNSDDSEEWPQYKANTQEYLVLDETLVDGPGIKGSRVRSNECVFWKHLLPQLENAGKCKYVVLRINCLLPC